MKLKKAAVNVGMTAAFPVFVFVVFWGITHLFNMQTPFGFSLLPNVLQNMGVGLLIALGMCINMTTQRIDLSAGAVTTVTAIFIGSIAAENNWPGWLFMLACIATGMLCSTFSGVVYVTLKLPPKSSALVLWNLA